MNVIRIVAMIQNLNRTSSAPLNRADKLTALNALFR